MNEGISQSCLSDFGELMSEAEASAWLAERNIKASVRKLQAMRADGDLGHVKMKHGTPKIRMTAAQLTEAFIGNVVARNTTPSPHEPSAPPREPRRPGPKPRKPVLNHPLKARLAK